MPEFIRVRGEALSLLVAALLLAGSARPIADLLGLDRRRVGDLFWNAGAAFVIAGRVAYLVAASPRSLVDALVVIRFWGGIDPIAGVLAAAAAGWWIARRAPALRAPWAAATALGLAVATVGYDAACVVRDACYGATAPPPLGFRMSGLADTRLATPLVEAAAVLLVLAALLAAWRRLGAATVAAWTFAALALLRAALTPASVAGRSAVDAVTWLTLIAGLAALAAGAWLTRRARRPDTPRTNGPASAG